MKVSFAFLFYALCLLDGSLTKVSSPEVQVYSRTLGQFDKPNTLICHVSGFHPPEITIDLLRDRQKMSGTTQTDLAFEENWHYHLTKHVPFTPVKGVDYACNVTHMGTSLLISWAPDV